MNSLPIVLWCVGLKFCVCENKHGKHRLWGFCSSFHPMKLHSRRLKLKLQATNKLKLHVSNAEINPGINESLFAK